MFDTLLESRHQALGLPRWGVALAMALHAAAVGALVRPRTAAPPEPPIIEIFEPAPAEPAPRLPRGGPSLPAIPLVGGIENVPLPPVVIEGLTPSGDVVDVRPSFPVPGPWSAVSGPWTPGGSEPVSVDAVQDLPVLLSAPVPVYPPMLREAGVEGVVLVQVVLDTLGHPEAGSLRVVRSSAAAFEQPAVEAIGRALFRPARIWGRAVRVLVQVPVAFRVRS